MEGRQPLENADAATLLAWFAEGESIRMDVAGISVTVRYVGRKGRRARIAISAPPGTQFIDKGKST